MSSHMWNASFILALSSACGSPAPGGDALAEETSGGGASGAEATSGGDGDAQQTQPSPLGAAGANEAGREGSADALEADATESFVTFVDPESDFSTVEVYDADREVVHFDAALSAMISPQSGDVVPGWNARGSDLSWGRSSIAFRVRFGTEAGERRAYFTETDRGTICDLTISGPDLLSISATSETPPDE